MKFMHEVSVCGAGDSYVEPAGFQSAAKQKHMLLSAAYGGVINKLKYSKRVIQTQSRSLV